MKEHQAVFSHSLSGKFGRRDLLKMGAMLGLSAPVLERWLLNQGVAFAQSPGLIGYWPFNEGSGSSTQDVSGSGNNGHINGATWLDGRIGQALSFNGSSNSVDINKSVVNTSTSFTVAAWVQLSDLSNWHTAVSQDGNNVSGFYLQSTHPTAGGQFAFSLVGADSTGGVPIQISASFTPSLNTWYHLVGVYEAGSSQGHLYVNGALQNTKTVPAAWNATGETVIGRAKWGGPTDFWPGLIDEVHLYNYALNAQQVTTLYQADAAGLVGYWPLDDASGSSAADVSGKGYTGTLKGAPVWTAGKIGAALSFNGSSTTVDINKSVVNTSTSFTVAAWVQLSDLSNWHTVVSQDGNNVSAFSLEYTHPSVGGQFAFSLVDTDSTGGKTIRATSFFMPVANSWYYLVGVYDAKQSYLYVNGELQSTQTVPPAWNASGETVIGRAKWGNATNYWSGLIDDVRIYNRALSATDTTNLYQIATMFSPLRPPAVPLIVRGPYINTWLAGDTTPGTWPTFWNGSVKAITGMARIDGTTYLFLGAPGINQQASMTQTQLEVTPTQSRYVYRAGGVTLYLTFLSPVEATDIQRLSMPFGYIQAQAQSYDGMAHTVSLYFDTSGEWAHGTSTTLINWQVQQVAHSSGNLTAFTVTPASPNVLAETNEYPSWGQSVWATNSQSNLSYQSGDYGTVRGQFVVQGSLNNSMDTNMPRAINNNWPVFAFGLALGSINGQPTSPFVLALGHVRQPAVSYQGKQIPPLWQAYWSSWQQMLGFFSDDASAAFVRANTLDNTITTAAVAASGVHYAALCVLATRQAFGGVELVNTISDPWLFLKEISSNGNLSTVDVIYPTFPIFYYLNPSLISLIIAPILSYVESGLWPQSYCVHDLGAAYPNATGHNDGGGENMPVEETANMLIMAAAYVQQAGASNAASYSNAHYPIFRQWANYLNEPNGGNPNRPVALDPLLQNQTDDFSGTIAHSTNLALKGIIAIGAMSIIAQAAGNTIDQQFYASTASRLIGQWAQLGQDSTQAHLDIAYSESDTAANTGPGTYSLKYNAFSDKLLGLNLVAASVLDQEAAWYLAQAGEYGIPLDSRHTYTLSNWEIMTAASTNSLNLRKLLVDAIYRFYDISSSRVPATDWYDINLGTQVSFQARPVVGGFFALLARVKSGH